MSKISVSIIGASGRLGSEILNQILNSSDFNLTEAVVSSKSSKLGLSVGVGEVKFVQSCGAKTDVIIDASNAERLSETISEANKLGAALLILSTGHDPEAFKSIKLNSPFCYAPNTSYGVYLITEAVRLLASQAKGEFSFHLTETHHKLKKDAPSGTAILISNVAKDCGVEVETQSIRGGTVAGEHELKMLGAFEEITLTHNAQSRALFAHGALVLAARLIKRKPGNYSAADLFNGSN